MMADAASTRLFLPPTDPSLRVSAPSGVDLPTLLVLSPYSAVYQRHTQKPVLGRF